jgi:hypothetical protein
MPAAEGDPGLHNDNSFDDIYGSDHEIPPVGTSFLIDYYSSLL